MTMRLMRVLEWFACPALAVVLAAGAFAALPEPPQQHMPWQPLPVNGVPDYLPELVAMLFDAGLADPRGGEYRQIELSTSSGQRRTWTTKGWYFPEGFAVGWDGMVHRVERAGDRADLVADITAQMSTGERSAMVLQQSTLVAAALLLRIGEVDLARRVLLKHPIVTMLRSVPPDSEETNRERSGWFQDAGTGWLSGAFHQAVEAHASGDDRLAIDIAEWLLQVRPAFEAIRKQLGPPSRFSVGSPADFLDPVPALLADSARRLKESPRPPLEPIAMRGMLPPARIAALIERLEDVNERQISQPGGVWIMGSPICKMLAEEGADAVDPLLGVLDHDQRLTRSYSFGRNYHPPRHLISVSEAAEAVLRSLFGIDTFRWKDAAKRREWLLRNKHRSLAERSFDLLAEDKPDDEFQWLDAAKILVRPNKDSGIVGDELRGRRDPSVSDLLAKRAVQMANDWAGYIGMALYHWDPPASIPVLQKLANRGYAGQMGQLYGQIAAARLQLGDPSAGSEWAAGIKYDQIVLLDHLLPLWTSPEDESVRTTARKLFLDPGSPMLPSTLIANGRLPADLLRSPLLLDPSFREGVFAGLRRTEVIGTAERLPDGTSTVRAAGIGTSFAKDDRRPPGKREIRTGDFVAWQLSQIDGFPKFDIEWPTDEKDKAIGIIAAFLRAHAQDLHTPAVFVGFPPPVVSLILK